MKKMRIMIILISSILVLLCIAVGLLYFLTDIFKEDKDAFYKYASKITIKDLIDEKFYSEYADKIKTNKNQREGSILVEGVSNNTKSEIVKVNYNTKTDNQNKLGHGEITVNNKEQELLKINTLSNENLYGLKIDGILNKYIAIENNNLKELAQKLGVTDTSSIPDKIDFNNLEMTQESKKELKELSEKYMTTAIEQIPKERYTKIENLIQVDGQELNANGYKLSLTMGDIFNIYIKAIETAKNDEKLFNFVNKHYLSEQYTYEQYQSMAEQLFMSAKEETLGDEEANTELLSISVYKKSGKLVKASIDINEGNGKSNVSIEYNSNRTILNIDKRLNMMSSLMSAMEQNNESRLLINIERQSDASSSSWQGIISVISQGKEEGKATINMNRVGDIKSESVEHKMIINVADSNGNGVVVTWDDKNNFVSSIDIEQFNNENHVILNDLKAEQINVLLEQVMIKVGQRLQVLSTLVSGNDVLEQSESAQRETKITAMKEGIALVEAEIKTEKMNLGGEGTATAEEIADRLREKGIITEIQYQEALQFGYITIEGEKIELNKDDSENTTTNMSSQLNKQAIQMFNTKFTGYEGVQSFANIKSLMSIIEASNSANIEHHVTVSGVANTPSGVSAAINSQKKYKVSFTYDSNGYITNAKIEDAV